ncbi:leucine-rich repeat-containing protein 15-like isoform X3 [Agrilus planipennis]|uniref:Leucine-rich repeat-containing protein 15-like isoform X3 n=1 Tax=Agrilus planipennis TaxID=224129 RepID=A0A7F5RK76_AGRPL|nr:leucine-rich repeat-containing protein 15-like isoform X3 [Agrilus planipennis]
MDINLVVILLQFTVLFSNAQNFEQYPYCHPQTLQHPDDDYEEDRYNHLTSLTCVGGNTVSKEFLSQWRSELNYNVYKALFMNGYLNSIPEMTFSVLPDLEEIYLTKCGINVLEVNAFTGLQSLKVLDLDKNNIREINAGVLSKLISLKTLTLSNNQLVTIHKGAFDGLLKLEYLFLSGNNLEFLANELFSHMTFIQTIDLSSNHFKTLNSSTFNSLVTLSHLNLNSSRLEYLPSFLFKDLSQLVTLDMSNNSLTNISSGLLLGLEKLTKLDISHNQLTKLTFNDLYFLSNLIELNVSYNNIGLLNAKEFITFLPHVKYIYIDRNNWTCSILSSIVKDFKVGGITIMYGSSHSPSNVFGIPCIKSELSFNKNGESEISQYSEYFSSILMELVEKVSNNNNLMEQLINANLNSSRNIQFLAENAQKIVVNAKSSALSETPIHQKHLTELTERANNHLNNISNRARINSDPIQSGEVNQQFAINNHDTAHVVPVSENNWTKILTFMDNVKEQSQMTITILNAIKSMSEAIASIQADVRGPNTIPRKGNHVSSERLVTNPSESNASSGNVPIITCLSIIIVTLLVILGFICMRNTKGNSIVHGLRRFKYNRSQRNISDTELTANSDVMLNSGDV